MSNPYQPPLFESRGPDPKDVVQGPATALIVVSSIAVGVGLVFLLINFYLITSGAAEKLDQLNRGQIPHTTKITVRVVWGAILVVASTFVLFGSIQMKKMKNYAFAKGAAIVSVIPCIGPCYILGLPFGIWALIVLGKPEVQDAFD
jgi:hypothetical protein